MSIPSGFFSTVTESYFGLDPQAVEAEELWGEFVETLPAGTSIDPEDHEIQKQYMEFLAGRLTSVYKSEEKGALSPKEIEARDIFFAIFSIAIEMLKSLQDCVRAQSQLLKFYADWQKEYTDTMAQTPIYGPLANTRILVNDDDFGQTKLGFAGTTISQTYDYLLNDIENYSFSGGSRTTLFAHGSFEPFPKNIGEDDEDLSVDSRHIVFRLEESRTSPGEPHEYTAYIDFYSYEYDASGGGDPTEEWTPYVAFTSETIAPPADLEGQELNSYIVNTLMKSLTEDWKDKTTNSPDEVIATRTVDLGIGMYDIDFTLTYGDLKELWGPTYTTMTAEDVGNPIDPGFSERLGNLIKQVEYGSYLWGPWKLPKPGAWPETMASFESQYSDEDKIEKYRAASQAFRGELNAQLQLFIQNTDARKQQVRDMSEGTEAVINQIRESIQAQSSLLTAITESLRSLLSAIFR